MSISHGDFLALACCNLGEDPASEMLLRNAGSRAYYALFHRARERIGELGLHMVRIKDAGDHQRVIETLRQLSPKAKSFATSMEGLKRFRHNCDYDLELPITKLRVQKHVAETKRLLDMLDRIEVDPKLDSGERAAL